MTKSTQAAPSTAAWRFLATVVRLRREHLGYSQEELVDEGGPAKSTVSKIERATQEGYSSRIEQLLERSLGWKRGTFQEILRHADADYFESQRESIVEELVEAPAPERSVKPARPSSAADLTDEELLTELSYRMRRYALEREGGREHGDSSAQKIDDEPFTHLEVESL